MPPTFASTRPTLGAALLLMALFVAPAVRAQDAEPGDAPAPAAAAKPKPRPKPVPKPAPKPAAAAPAAAQGTTQGTTQATAQGTAAVWPPEATSVSESYGDWTVSCTRPGGQSPICAVVQSQGDSKTGQRKFGFELSTPKDGRSDGVVLMPFGMAIEPGVTFKLDEQALGKGAPYSTCSAEGCLVPISFPTLATDGMRTAKTLTVIGQKASGTEPATIVVPLTGFPKAFDRAVALSG